MRHDNDHQVVRRALLLTVAASLALPTAACSASPSPRPGPGAYSACMRKHGVTGAFASPPPTSFPTRSGSHKNVAIPAKVATAMQACLPLAPKPKSSGLQAP